MAEKIKNKINLKSSLSKSNKFIEIQMLSTEISTLMLERKEKYFHDLSMKLIDPKTSAKTYCSILKSFYIDSKIPLIPPLLVNHKIVSDFTEKTNLFNDFFATQCTPISNNSILPSAISFKAQSRLSSVNFEKEDIRKMIRNLNVNKACGHDNVSIRILKICDSVSAEPLPLIYKNWISSGVFPDIWKRSCIIPTYKKVIKVALITTALFLYLWQNI